MRSLAILERLSALSYAADLAEKLVDALLAMLTQKAGKRHAHTNYLLPAPTVESTLEFITVSPWRRRRPRQQLTRICGVQEGKGGRRE